MTRLLPVATVVLAIAASTHAHAQLFGGDDQARRQIAELRAELGARIDASSRAQLELSNQNERLRSEVARLRGQVEVLTHEVESLKQRQRDFYVDLDDRLRGLEQHGAATPSDPAVAAAEYEAALNLLKEGRHADSLAAFRKFIADHPRSDYLPGANFWAGNAALQAKEVAAARNFFDTVIKTWPDDAIAPDAMLGLANSLQLMGEARAAQDTLRQIMSRYPDSSAAQVAGQRVTPSQ
ncbi:MAG TPA: tol-pal system protein YbgF [Rhodocyclaceae bacterium]|nr:tol-pal system protein YbgF [Rhodocyclaceae bacterium]